MNNWIHLVLRFTIAALIVAAIIVVGMSAKDHLNFNGWLSSGTLTLIVLALLTAISTYSLSGSMPIKPLWLTLTTLAVYLLVGQFTFEWADRMIPFVGLGTILNFIVLGLFVRAFMHAPTGEIKKAEIGRFEFAGSPFPLNIVLSQGGATVPHFFGWEVLNRITPLFASLSVKLNDGTEGNVGISVWFRVINPSTLDEFNLKEQVIPRLQRIFEGEVRNWASQLSSQEFSNQTPIIQNGNQISSIESLEQHICPILMAGATTRVLRDFGLAFDDMICSDPKLTKAQDKIAALKGMLRDLMQNSGLSMDKALNVALVLSGEAQLVMLGLGGKGGNKGGNVIADVDEDNKKGKGGGKDGKDEKKDEKKLSDPPKARKGGYKIILVLWTILAFISFTGWGKNSNQNTADIKASDVSEAIAVGVEKLNPNNLLPKRLNQPALDIFLVDNCKGEWIVSNGIDKYGNHISDDKGWILNDQEGYLRAKVRDLKFDQSAPSNEVLIEAELETGELVRFASNKNGDWFLQVGEQKRPVYFLTLLENSKRFRVKVLDPHPEHPLSMTILRSK